MARITITIDAEDPGELRRIMAELAGGDANDIYEVDYDDRGVAVVAAKDDAPARTRGRPRKAQTAAPADTAASGAPAPGVTGTTDTGVAVGLTATTAASPSEPAGGVGKEAVQAKMSEAMDATTPLKVQEALEAAGLPKRLSEIPAEQYGAAIGVFDKLIAMA